jgi:uncharacterized membrane protein
VPHLAVTVGVALAMLSLAVLIFFIHHVATSIQASRIIANVADDLEGAINRLFPEAIGEDSATAGPGGASPDASDALEEDVREVPSTTTGYVQAIDAQRLMEVARERNVVVRVRERPGAFVTKGRVPAARQDDDGRVRVFACPVTFASIVERAFDEIGRYGRSSISVTCRLLEAVRRMDRVCTAKRIGRRCCGRQRRLPGRFAKPHSARATVSGLPDVIARPSPLCMSHPTNA